MGIFSQTDSLRKLTKTEKDQFQRNYSKFYYHAKIKRIEAKLYSSLVIDSATKSKWKNMDDEEMADSLHEVLREGTVSQCAKAKEILTSDGQAEIANLLP